MENMLIEVRKLSGRLNESYVRITYTSHQKYLTLNQDLTLNQGLVEDVE